MTVLFPYWENISPRLWNLAIIALLTEDALKLSIGGQSNYFYQPPSETTLKWERPLMDVWSKNHQISSSTDGKTTTSPCEVLIPATLLPTPEGSLPFHSCLETLNHWRKPWEGLSEDPLTNPKETWYTDGSSLSWMEKRRAGYAVVSNFETIEAKLLPPGTSA